MSNDKRDQRDEDSGKGAVAQDSPEQKTNVSAGGQIGHRDQDPMLKSSDTDFPEPGENEEHTGEPQDKNQLASDSGLNAEGITQDQDPGVRQKQNQNNSKRDLPAD